MISRTTLRWSGNIPDVSSTNLGSFFFPCEGGSHWGSGRRALGHVRVCCCLGICLHKPLMCWRSSTTPGKINPCHKKLPFDFLSLYVKSPAPLFLPGRSPAAQSLWETLLTSKHKEAVMEVRRQLVEAASKEKLPIKMSMGEETQRVF